MNIFFFFKQKTAYEMRISDWSSDVCSSDLREEFRRKGLGLHRISGRLGNLAERSPRPGRFGSASAGSRNRTPRPVPTLDEYSPSNSIPALSSARSEERRVGKECVSTCRSRWSLYH